MDVIPAKVAGVSEIVMTTPARKDGKVDPVILAAAATAGVTKIFKTGGAQAVAALAYGTQTARPSIRSSARATSTLPPPSGRSLARWAST